MVGIMTLAAETTDVVDVAEVASESVQETVQAVSSGVSVLAGLGETFVSYLPTIIGAALVYILALIVSKLIIKAVSKVMIKGKMEETLQGFVKSLLKVVLNAFVAVIVLSVLGVPMTSIITVIGACGLAVGLALQDSLTNIAGGFLVLYAKPFVKGDYIASNGVEGVVEGISILSTKIITLDNKVIYIPNGSVAGSTLTNYTAEGKRRVDLEFNISNSEDFYKASEIIIATAKANDKVIDTDMPTARVFGLTEKSVTIISKSWCKTEDYWDVYHDLLEQVKTALDKNGIKGPRGAMNIYNVKD